MREGPEEPIYRIMASNLPKLLSPNLVLQKSL